jgi:molybdopterin synthase sulfur carrier subunit
VNIKIRLPPVVQPDCGAETCEVNGETVGECLEELEARFPAIKEHLLDRQGNLLSIFGIYMNNGGIHRVGMGTPVHDGDEIIILNLIMGG